MEIDVQEPNKTQSNVTKFKRYTVKYLFRNFGDKTKRSVADLDTRQSVSLDVSSQFQ